MGARTGQDLLTGIGVAERLLVEDQPVSGDRAADIDREPLAVERDVGVERIDAAADRAGDARAARGAGRGGHRSEEHTSELQSLMRISYAVFCLNKKTNNRSETTKPPSKL